MKAVYIEAHGRPETIVYGERPDPVVGRREVLVDTHATSENGADRKVRSGWGNQVEVLPHILGRHFSVAARLPEIVLYRLSAAAESFRIGEARHPNGKLVRQVR